MNIKGRWWVNFTYNNRANVEVEFKIWNETVLGETPEEHRSMQEFDCDKDNLLQKGVLCSITGGYKIKMNNSKETSHIWWWWQNYERGLRLTTSIERMCAWNISYASKKKKYQRRIRFYTSQSQPITLYHYGILYTLSCSLRLGPLLLFIREIYESNKSISLFQAASGIMRHRVHAGCSVRL